MFNPCEVVRRSPSSGAIRTNTFYFRRNLLWPRGTVKQDLVTKTKIRPSHARNLLNAYAKSLALPHRATALFHDAARLGRRGAAGSVPRDPEAEAPWRGGSARGASPSGANPSTPRDVGKAARRLTTRARETGVAGLAGATISMPKSARLRAASPPLRPAEEVRGKGDTAPHQPQGGRSGVDLVVAHRGCPSHRRTPEGGPGGRSRNGRSLNHLKRQAAGQRHHDQDLILIICRSLRDAIDGRRKGRSDSPPVRKTCTATTEKKPGPRGGRVQDAL